MRTTRKRQLQVTTATPKVLKMPRLAPEHLAELVSVSDIVATGAVSMASVRRAYRTGVLKGFIPTGRDPRHTGRGGYRFRKGDVLAWLYSDPKPAPPAEEPEHEEEGD